MIFKIDTHSAKPVYQQIIDQVKYAVAAGRLLSGDRLAPIREVAVQTRINRNTVARAYMELEREGVIRSNTGQGSFVSDNGSDLGRVKARAILSELIDDLLSQAHQFRFSRDDISALVGERVAELKVERGKGKR